MIDGRRIRAHFFLFIYARPRTASKQTRARGSKARNEASSFHDARRSTSREPHGMAPWRGTPHSPRRARGRGERGSDKQMPPAHSARPDRGRLSPGALACTASPRVRPMSLPTQRSGVAPPGRRAEPFPVACRAPRSRRCLEVEPAAARCGFFADRLRLRRARAVARLDADAVSESGAARARADGVRSRMHAPGRGDVGVGDPRRRRGVGRVGALVATRPPTCR